MSGLIWIQTVWHSDGIPERIFRKSCLWIKSADDIKSTKNYPVRKESRTYCDRNIHPRSTTYESGPLLLIAVVLLARQQKNSNTWTPKLIFLIMSQSLVTKTRNLLIRHWLSMLGNFSCVCRLLIFFKINFFKKFFQEYHQSFKQFGSRSGQT